jgi:hypothetical protein
VTNAAFESIKAKSCYLCQGENVKGSSKETVIIEALDL